MNSEHDNTPEIVETQSLLALDAARLGESAPLGLEDRVYAASVGSLRALRLAGGESRGPEASTGRVITRRALVTPLRIAACVAMLGVVGAAFLARSGSGENAAGEIVRAEMTPGVDPEIDSLFFLALDPENDGLRDEIRAMRADAARLGEQLSGVDEPYLGDDEGSM